MFLQLWICSINVGFKIIFFTFTSPYPKVLFRIYKCLLRGPFRFCFKFMIYISPSHNMHTMIALYKAPKCSFEEFESVAHLQISNELIIVGDFNFDVTRNMNKNFIYL